MNCYIIGGNGFVGKYLANELVKRNNHVVVCDMHLEQNRFIDSKADYLSVDIRNEKAVETIPFSTDDIVIHLAANQYHTKVPHDRVTYFFDTNYVGTKNLLKAMCNAGCNKLIMFTTDMTYGKPQYLPVDTIHPQVPFGPYGKSKLACERLCREYRDKGMNITIFRPRMINGPGRLGILVKLFKLIDMNLPVPTIGNGKNHYQMVSVFDCVEAVVCAMNKGVPNDEYNLGSKNSPDITSLLRGVIKEAKSHSFVMHTPGKIMKRLLGVMDKIGLTLMYPEQFMIADEEYVLDIEKTEKELDWHPRYNDEDMLKKAYKMYKEKQ